MHKVKTNVQKDVCVSKYPCKNGKNGAIPAMKEQLSVSGGYRGGGDKPGLCPASSPL